MCVYNQKSINGHQDIIHDLFDKTGINCTKPFPYSYFILICNFKTNCWNICGP